MAIKAEHINGRANSFSKFRNKSPKNFICGNIQGVKIPNTIANIKLVNIKIVLYYILYHNRKTVGQGQPLSLKKTYSGFSIPSVSRDIE